MTDLFDHSYRETDEAEPAEVTPAEAMQQRRRASRERAAKRRAQRRRTVLTFVVMVGALVLLVGGGWVLIRPILLDQGDEPAVVTDYPGPGAGEVEVVVNAGDTGAAIGATLESAGVVATSGAFVEAYNDNPDAVSIQAGTFRLQEEMRAADAVAALLDPANRADAAITIPEGWTAAKIFDRIASVLGVPVADVKTAANEVAASTLPPEAGGNIEGWLFPATYTISEGSTAATVLEEMVLKTISVLDERNVPAEHRQNVLIEASIVEAEVPSVNDWGRVARVIQNRLDGCSGDGTLGMDTTYQYGLGIPAGDITSAQWATEHPFNTRMTPGLPPTPIGSPGAGAIDAVLNPTEGDWCYFVTVNLQTGETVFTDNIDDHEVAVRELREWLDANEDLATETPAG